MAGSRTAEQAVAKLPQVREYVRYYLADRAGDDAIVRISFDSEATMREALAIPEYRVAHDRDSLRAARTQRQLV